MMNMLRAFLFLVNMQSQGIGKILLNYAKDKRNKLHLNVYQKNARAISFYKREGFEIQHSEL